MPADETARYIVSIGIAAGVTAFYGLPLAVKLPAKFTQMLHAEAERLTAIAHSLVFAPLKHLEAGDD